MESPRVAILSYDRLRLPRHRFQVVGGPDVSLESLAAQDPQLVLLGYQDPAKGLEHLERILPYLPAAAVLMAGPALEPELMVHAMRAGVREVLTDPSEADVEAALERAWSYLQRLKGSGSIAMPVGKVIVVHSPKGGVGKSTLAVNLACALRAKCGQEVALVDLALHSGDLDCMLNAKPRVTFSDLAQSEQFGAEELEVALARCADGIRLLAAPQRPEDAELVGPAAVERAIAKLRGRYPYVVVDTAAVLNESTLRAMDLAHRIMVPLPLTLPALRQVKRGLALWSQLGVRMPIVDIVLWDPQGELTMEHAQKVLHQPTAYRVPFEPKGIVRAMNSGEPLVLAEPRSAYAKAIAAMAETVMGIEKPAASEARWQGWWKQVAQQVRRQGDVTTQQA